MKKSAYFLSGFEYDPMFGGADMIDESRFGGVYEMSDKILSKDVSII